MVVPMARSRMSNNPPTKAKGKGVMDILKSVGKAVAPMAIEAGRKMIKDKYGFGVDLSQAQMRSLKKGGAIQLKPSQMMEQGKQLLQLLPQSAKKLMSALKKSKGMRLLLKEGEDVVDRLTGGSIFGSIFKAVAPMLIDAGASFLSRKARGGASADVSMAYKDAMNRHSAGGGIFPAGRRGSGLGSFLKKGISAIAPMAIDAGAEFLKKKVSGRGIFPAGGAVMPSMPIQLGSPYQSMSSPAMNPFVGTTGLSGYAPITAGDRSGGAMMPMDGIMKASRSRMVGTKPSTYTPAYLSMK